MKLLKGRNKDMPVSCMGLMNAPRYEPSSLTEQNKGSKAECHVGANAIYSFLSNISSKPFKEVLNFLWKYWLKYSSSTLTWDQVETHLDEATISKFEWRICAKGVAGDLQNGVCKAKGCLLDLNLNTLFPDNNEAKSSVVEEKTERKRL